MNPTHAYDEAAGDIRRPGAEQPLGEPDARELIRHAALAASSHNTQPWSFRIESDRITILPDYSRRCPVVDPDDGHLFKSLGCAAENLVHAAAAQGFSTDVRFDARDDAVTVLLHPDATARATELYRAIPRRQSVKAAYDGRPVDSVEVDALAEAGRQSSVRAILLTSDEQKDAVVDYVNRGNAAQLTDMAFRNELASWIRFNPADALRQGDGLAGRTSGQPALPSWLAKAILRFIITPEGQAKTDAAAIKSAAGVAVFVSSQDGKAAWVDVGRAYERFALQATALEIRTAFINQPLEVHELRPALESWLGLEGEHALLMVRFGHGPTAPFSLRRPIDDVILAA